MKGFNTQNMAEPPWCCSHNIQHTHLDFICPQITRFGVTV